MISDSSISESSVAVVLRVTEDRNHFESLQHTLARMWRLPSRVIEDRNYNNRGAYSDFLAGGGRLSG
ncbi:hypothetical protein [Streptomyces sp. NPDC060065]|uniref:hypothetical protein n=1 Tax=Streptomyces sp. NPDC060065 TaxID=3347050 RepID=UPI00369605EB